MMYELGTLMVPIDNITSTGTATAATATATATADTIDTVPPGYEWTRNLPWGPMGCTGIIAKNKVDGTVYHARNQDFSPLDLIAPLVYNGVFTKGGKEVFRSQVRTHTCTRVRVVRGLYIAHIHAGIEGR